MSRDTMLRQILKIKELNEKYWPEITDPNLINLNIIQRSPNIYLRYLYAVICDETETNKNKIISTL